MKKFCCIFLLLSSLNTYSQSVIYTASKKFTYGIKMGVAFANLRGNEEYRIASITNQTKIGLLAGVYGSVLLGQHAVFQPALLYVRKGARVMNTYAPVSYQYNYFELPLNVLYKLPLKNGKYYLGGGLAPAIKTAGYDIYRDLNKRFDLGINLLAAYKVPIGFSINLNYTYGLLNVSGFSTAEIKNRYVGLTAGYEF